jgi:phosphonate degradation associated HDIG domain protein
MDVVRHIETLFRTHGNRRYDGARGEPVSALAHALQCAQLAEWAHAEPTLVAAALLHDIGHFSDGDLSDDLTDDRHEVRPLPLLREHFGMAVAEPVRLHVDAKRYLVATLPEYAASLSPASVHSLALQGGPMSTQEVEDFDALPYARQAVALRRWDDLAKVPGKTTPSLDYYLVMLDELRHGFPGAGVQRIGALDVA